ncbi:flagellar biosynthetic protein FliR [Legionella sp. MW5194]|uniref:flagellar biosynthetic protein FliR n=1 Tax=Legionella sp. MW5194 TaxID=2662448 RepID=UPI00193E056D|nr:flagellar biosynthetic protein FliR [Legionella sp. MW5194]QRN03271.1 flagellar biosynthetic protein FliR [Legionella sp. MW5194]
MDIDYKTMIIQISQVVWPMPRISGLFLTMPVISSVLIPVRVRVVIAMAFSFLLSSFVPSSLTLEHFNGYYLIYLAFELLLGLMMGFVLQMVFQVFVIGGQIIAMQAGLGFATMIDPASKASVPLISQFYLLMVSLMFLALNGHLAVFELFFNSFTMLPVGSVPVELSDIGRVLIFSGWMMKESVLVALPAILALLVISLAFGVMTRVAPQLNIFSIGFPITLFMGIVILRVSLPGVAAQIADSLEQGMLLIKGLLY